MQWLLGFLFFLEIVSILSVIFLERKNPSEALAWIVVVSLVPGIGLIIYLMFGDTIAMRLDFKFYKNKELARKENEIITKQIEDITRRKESDSLSDEDALSLMLLKLSKSRISSHNEVKTLINADEKYPLLFKELMEAKQSIHVAYYIISDNQSGWEFLKILAKKAKEGVEVKLIYDYFGGWFLEHRHPELLAEIKNNGGKIIRFLPTIASSIYRINYRYHRKMVIIDQKIGYTGGINIGDEYLGKRKKCSPWRDTSIRVYGEAVNDLMQCFVEDWNLVLHYKKNQATSTIPYYEPTITNNGNLTNETCKMQIVKCGPEAAQEDIKDAYLKMISGAKKYVYIQTPYFIPDDTFQTTLKLAKQSGVDVRIMIPGIPDKKTVYAVTLSHMSDYLKSGGTVYKYPGFIHSKTIVVDDKITTIGTTNIDIRSFNLDFEINAFIYDQKQTIINKEIFLNDASKCKQYHYDDYKNESWIIRGLGNLFRLFSLFL